MKEYKKDIMEVVNITFPQQINNKYKVVLLYYDSTKSFKVISEYFDTYKEACMYYLKYYSSMIAKKAASYINNSKQHQ